MVAVAGLAVSAWIHVHSLLGRVEAPEELLEVLHVGIFVVWFPTVLQLIARGQSGGRRGDWK